MQPTPGIPRNRRLQHHILRRCSKYKDVTLAASSPVLQMPPPQAPASTAPPPAIAPRPPASMSPASRAPPASPAPVPPSTARPTPVICKKRSGTCKHVIAFGDHYDRNAWAKYEEYINGQHAITETE